jgi:hypothetical protein
MPDFDTSTPVHVSGMPAVRIAPPLAIRIRTLADLREYAATHGITLTGLPSTADTPPKRSHLHPLIAQRVRRQFLLGTMSSALI